MNRWLRGLTILQFREGLLLTSLFSPLNPIPFWTLSVTTSLLNLIIGPGRPKPQHFSKFCQDPRAKVLPGGLTIELCPDYVDFELRSSSVRCLFVPNSTSQHFCKAFAICMGNPW